MANDRESKRKPSYTRAPKVTDSETLERYTVALQVMNEELTMGEASQQLGLTRVQTQTLVHRAQAAALTAVTPKPAGRPAKSPRVRQLEETNRRLQQELEQARKELSQKNALLQVASEVLRDRACTAPARARRPMTPRKRRRPDSEEPDDAGPPELLLAQAEQLRQAGVNRELTSAIVGAGKSTLRRWCSRVRHGLPPRARRGPPRGRNEPAPDLAARAVALVRELRGGIGAEPLRRAVPGLSRRQAACLKAETVSAMERERKAAATKVSVTVLGAVRGFDAMHLETLYGRQYILEAIDACVPYRTCLVRADCYDAASVAVTLERDFLHNGAPLVLRQDRASVHRAPEVLAVCEDFGVIVLHGPPHLPRFYGQLERQNREHRDWLQVVEITCPVELDDELELMRTRLNEIKPRRTLGWNTAAERWKQRRDFGSRNAPERLKFSSDVNRHTESILRGLDDAEPHEGFAHRLAVQAALIERGLLRLSRTGRC